jgi:hypothetical protein
MVTVSAEVCPEKIMEASKVFLELACEDPGIPRASLRFLESVVEGRCFQHGDKGTLLLWGGSWNYFREEDFTPWLARLIDATPGEWLTNVQLSWELEQTECRRVKVFWFSCRGGKLLWAEVPPDKRMHWGVCGDSGPVIGDRGSPGSVILDVEGKKYPDSEFCSRCKAVLPRRGAVHSGFHWEGGWRKCVNCGYRVPVLKAHIWEDK